MEFLLSASADVNARDSEFGWTPLLVAAQQGSPTIVQRLLDAGANLHASTTDGRTAVAIARTDKKMDIAAMLEELGCRAENTVTPPPRLPWPDMDRNADNVDFHNPESVVCGLIIAMNQFEKKAHRTSSSETVSGLLADVYARFCTTKKRPYGRNGSYQVPPEYDPREEYLVETTIVNPRRAEVVTRNEMSKTEYLDVLQKKGGIWLVDSKKYRLIGGKWDVWSI
ncbi:MAG: NTF2 fold immunity protein [Planctomycetota bacterium]